MSKNDQILRKLMLAQENPDLNIGFDTKDLAALVITVMKAVKTIEQSMSNGQLDIGAKLKKDIAASIKDGRTSFQAIVDNLDKITSNHKTTTDNLNQKVQDAIALMQTRVAELKDGEDAEVTDEHIRQAAEIASALVELPDFDEMVDTAIKSSGESIVDAINLLPDGDGVEMSKVKGLLSLIDQVKTQIARIPTGQGGTIGKGQVYNFIRQAIADGTINTGGLPDQTGNTGKFLTTDGTDASWGTPAGSGDVVGPASAVDSNFAAFDTTTGKLIKDSGVTTATFATAAQGSVADTATQPGDNISTLVNDAGYLTAETDDQTAAEVPFTPAGDIVATDVQAAIEELDSEKGTGDVNKVGTPVNNQVGVWTGDGTLEGSSGLTFDGTDLILTDSEGLVVGHTGREQIGNQSAVQILGTSATDASMVIGRWTATAATPASLRFFKSINPAIGSNTIVPDNALIGSLDFYADDGVDNNTRIADIHVEVDDASPAAGDIGAAFVWRAMQGGGTGLTEQMRLAADGTLTVGGNEVYSATGTDVPVADGGTGASTAAGARTNLGAAAISTSINAQTGTTYTLVIGDVSTNVTMSNASANTLTVPPNSSVAFPVGTKVLVTQSGAGATTIAAGAGVTINAPSTVTLAIGEQHESRGLIKVATDTWTLM